MRFPLLHSDRLWLIDCEVTKQQINAGWVYLDGNLSSVETVSDGELSFQLTISPKVQKLAQPSEFYLPNDVIEFLRC